MCEDKKRFTELLKDLDGWEIIYEDINILSKTYSFDNYEDSVKFATDIAKLAEDEDHHPSILLEWGSVRVQWWSHKIKDIVLTKNIPPTTNCQTNHFHPVSDKAHFRIGDFFAKLYKYFFIYLTHFSTQEK